VPGGIAVLVYWLIALWFKVPAACEMTSLVRQRLRQLPRG
jgi:hypothetical protein